MELAEPFNVSLPAISRHLRVLERSGLLVQEKDGRVRRCQLVAEPLKDAAEWLAGYRRFWESQFDALTVYVTTLSNEEEPVCPARHPTSHAPHQTHLRSAARPGFPGMDRPASAKEMVGTGRLHHAERGN